MNTVTLEAIKGELEKITGSVEPLRIELAEVIAKTAETSDEAELAVLNAKSDSLLDEIEAANSVAKQLYRKYTALVPEEFNFKSKKQANEVSKVEELFGKMSFEGQGVKRSIGQYVGDFLKSRGVTDTESLANLYRQSNNEISFKFNLDNSDNEAVKEISAAPFQLKSLYSNNGTELLISGAPVPGYQGYGCSVFEIEDGCSICIAPSTFEDCLTVRNMPTGNLIQYDYQVSRVFGANIVAESIYNPYPGTVVQNGRKPEGTFTYATNRVPVVKIAERVSASDEVLDDCGTKVATRIDTHLMNGVREKRNQQLIAGTGTAGQMFGLLSQPGTLALNGTTLVTGVANPNMWDKLYAAQIRLEQNCATPDCVIVNSQDKYKVATAKNLQGDYLFPQMNCDSGSIGCFSLKVSDYVPVGTAIMGQLKDNWIYFSRKNFEVRVGMNGNDLIENMMTFVGELRGAAVLLCPSKVAIITNI